jgi:Phosphopantetheine attachment site
MPDSPGPLPSAAEITTRTVSWVADILDEPQAKASDNFLDLGGHSMLALQLSRRAEENFGLGYDMRVLFEESLAATAADLAQRMSTTDHPGPLPASSLD